MDVRCKYKPNDKFFSFTFISPIKEQPEEVRALFPGKNKGWYMQCECGSYRVYEAGHIVAGRITSCGCKRGENISKKRDHNKGNEKRKQTFKQRYGLENAGQLEDRSSRQVKAWKENRETILAKREASGTLFSSKRFKQSMQELGHTYRVEDTGESLQAWYERVQPIGAYQTYVREARILSKVTSENLLKVATRIEDNKSSLEQRAEELLGITKNNKQVSSEVPYRFDFKLSENVYLNVDGLYWHCEDKVDKNYHFKMRDCAEKAGIRLLQIRQNELLRKHSIIKSLIKNLLNKTPNKINARECVIKEVPDHEAELFYSITHMMGHCRAKHLGLFYNNTLVSVLSYKQKGSGLDITRFSSELNTIVRGGLSKLLKEVERRNPESIFIEYWVDLRYGNGKGLESLGFKHIKDQKGGFCWTDFENTFNRLKCTTKEKAKKLGWKKIYDAGQRCYVKYK